MKKKSSNSVELVPVADLKPHPRNYRIHQTDQLEHIVASLREHGFYRNVVVARDNTILAGHGVVLAASKNGTKTVPVIRLDIDPTSAQALKVLTGDNEISKLAEIDDRVLTEMLKEIKTKGQNGLLGTGFDENMLAALAMVTRPQSEIKNFDAAAEWVGMPAYAEGTGIVRIVISFRNEKDRNEFIKKYPLKIGRIENQTWMLWYPPKEKEDLKSVRFSSKKKK